MQIYKWGVKGFPDGTGTGPFLVDNFAPVFVTFVIIPEVPIKP